MNKQKPVVVLDDDAAVRSSLCAMLTSMGVSCEGFDSQNDFIDRIKSGPEVGALLIDLRLANETSGIQVLHDVRAVGNHRPAILMSGWEVGELDEALGPRRTPAGQWHRPVLPSLVCDWCGHGRRAL